MTSHVPSQFNISLLVTEEAKPLFSLFSGHLFKVKVRLLTCDNVIEGTIQIPEIILNSDSHQNISACLWFDNADLSITFTQLFSVEFIQEFELSFRLADEKSGLDNYFPFTCQGEIHQPNELIKSLGLPYNRQVFDEFLV